MYNHAPPDYTCPICVGITGIKNEHTLIREPDIVYKDEKIAVIINSFSLGGIVGNALVVPTMHYENVYDVPSELGGHIFSMVQKVARAMKQAYSCEGITTMQCNEPAGGQHAFHYHHHVMQRNDNDDFFVRVTQKKVADPEQRASYARKLQSILQS